MKKINCKLWPWHN